MRIMIVEDEQRARRGLHNLITTISDEYEIVAEASDGKQALELIHTVKPEVVFTDLKMPYMDGMSLIRAVNAMGLSTRFVIISAYEEFEMARQAISLNVQDYLIKPVTYDEVEELLKRLSAREGIGAEEIKNIQEKYPNAHPYVLKALNIIEKSYAAKISQKELAEDLGMTQEYFCYLFNKDVGETFSKFLKNYRIQIAKSLLVNKGVPREEVPYHVGFSDTKYFSKVFREVVGMSVSEFIKSAG